MPESPNLACIFQDLNPKHLPPPSANFSGPLALAGLRQAESLLDQLQSYNLIKTGKVLLVG